MPELKEPRFFGERHVLPHGWDGHQPAAGDDGGVPGAVRSTRASQQRAGEASPSYLGSERQPVRSQPLRPDARIVAILREPAELPALAAPAARAVAHRGSQRLRRGARARRSPPRRQGVPENVAAAPAGAPVCAARPLRGAAAPLPRCVPARAGPGADLRRLPRRQRGDGAKSAALPRRGWTSPIEALDANPSVRVRSQRLDRLLHAVSVGHGPMSRATKTAVKALTPRPVRRRALGAAQRRVVYARPREPDAAMMARAAQAIRGRGAGAERVPRPRPGEAVGL